MSCFQSKSTTSTSAPLDPSKHVNYALGMVLGVDDFNQEFAYLAGRDQWLARDLLGYGTICGLQVSIETDAEGPRVAVAPGAALNPRGQLIRVTSAQCAYLNKWLAKNKQEVDKQLGSPPGGVLNLFVVLCYRECPIDPVPIPGEPCRDVEESMTPSRLMDDFKLALSSEPPDQREEDAIQDFIVWLRQIEISDAPGAATLDQFLQAIRGSALVTTSPPISQPDFMYGSPPATMHIHPANICEYLRAGFRVWTTELRPGWRGQSKCGTYIPDEECVLLAQITIPIKFWSGNWLVDSAGTVMVNEEKRPYLIHLRMLQEWLLCSWKGSTCSPANSVVAEQQFGLSDNAGISAEYSRADHTHGTPPEPVLNGEVTGNVSDTTVAKIQDVLVAAKGAATPPDDHVLTIKSGKWQAAPILVPVLAGEVTGTVGDTTVAKIQAVPVAPGLATIPPDDHVLTIKTGKWQAAPFSVTAGDSVTNEISFGQLPNKGTAVAFSRADHTHGTPPDPIPAHKTDSNAHDLKGEITGPISNTKVAKIQEIAVVPTIPPGPGSNEGKVLTIHNNQWQAASPAIVAAGRVKGDETSSSPVYNNLKAKATGISRLRISFTGYKNTIQYVVKAMTVTNALVKMPIVTFTENLTTGIILGVTDGVNRIPTSTLEQLEFLIEVSRFE